MLKDLTIYLFFYIFDDFYRKNFWELRRIYKEKKKGFRADLKKDWSEDTRKQDIKVEKVRVPLVNGKVAIYCLFEVDQFIGHGATGLKYDLLGFVDEVPIRYCTFKEYLNIYGLYIFDGIDE